ncbi:hypothetical protein [Microbacterium sp.]|uniref:hypothetical protein n=1 Tax=Microbacterium sp. TaxID=51671 RepID=UPI0028119D0C|nr:hypothetical protein [Microbacterium sp.]
MKTPRTSPFTVRPSRRLISAAALVSLAGALAGCGLTVPSDPDGTLDTVTGGELRIGASPDPGLVDVTGPDPSGPLPDLATEFGDMLDAEAVWTVGSEEALVGMLEAGELDLVIGGITDQTPWIENAGTTRGYSGIPGADGRSLVLLVPPGENAFLSELERFLDEEVGS